MWSILSVAVQVIILLLFVHCLALGLRVGNFVPFLFRLVEARQETLLLYILTSLSLSVRQRFVVKRLFDKCKHRCSVLRWSDDNIRNNLIFNRAVSSNFDF